MKVESGLFVTESIRKPSRHMYNHHGYSKIFTRETLYWIISNYAFFPLYHAREKLLVSK